MLARGKRVYENNCSVCHDTRGEGNGPVVNAKSKYPFAPALNAAATQARSDGYIYGVVDVGRNFMPPVRRPHYAPGPLGRGHVRAPAAGAAAGPPPGPAQAAATAVARRHAAARDGHAARSARGQSFQHRALSDS